MSKQDQTIDQAAMDAIEIGKLTHAVHSDMLRELRASGARHGLKSHPRGVEIALMAMVMTAQGLAMNTIGVQAFCRMLVDADEHRRLWDNKQ